MRVSLQTWQKVTEGLRGLDERGTIKWLAYHAERTIADILDFRFCTDYGGAMEYCYREKSSAGKQEYCVLPTSIALAAMETLSSARSLRSLYSNDESLDVSALISSSMRLDGYIREAASAFVLENRLFLMSQMENIGFDVAEKMRVMDRARESGPSFSVVSDARAVAGRKYEHSVRMDFKRFGDIGLYYFSSYRLLLKCGDRNWVEDVAVDDRKLKVFGEHRTPTLSQTIARLAELDKNFRTAKAVDVGTTPQKHVSKRKL